MWRDRPGERHGRGRVQRGRLGELELLHRERAGGDDCPRVGGREPATGQGTWSDDLGHSGTFVFGGSIAGLPLRPSSPAVLSVADNPQGPDDPCAAPAPRPTLVLCGTAAGHWRNGGNGLAGLQVWRGRDGQVHIRGSVHRSAGSIALPVFVLPAGFVPRQTLALAVSTGLYGGATSEEPPC